MRKSVLSTSFRSDTHATDSTCRGCQAKIAAANPLRQVAPVILFKIRKSSNALAACRNRFVTW